MTHKASIIKAARDVRILTQLALGCGVSAAQRACAKAEKAAIKTADRIFFK